MKRGGPLKRSDKPMAQGGLPAPTKAQELVFRKLTDQVGCAVCRFFLKIEDTPAEIHHLLDGQRRISHSHVLPICPIHHRQGTAAHPSRHSVNGCHGGLDIFERTYGSEIELVMLCEDWIGQLYVTGIDENEQTPEISSGDSDSAADGHGDSDDVQEKPISLFPVQAFGKRVCISVMHHRVRLADNDNLNSKGIIDGLVEAGILQNDSPKYVKFVHHDQIDDAKTYKDEKAVVTIEEVAG